MSRKLQVILLFFILVIAACSNSNNNNSKTPPSNKNSTLVIGFDVEPEYINPILDESGFDHLIYRGLLKFDEKNEPVLDLGKSIQISDDGLLYTIELHNDVKFSDGTKLTADDVVFTYETIFNDAVLSMIRPEYEEIESVTKTNDYEVAIQLKSPFPPIKDKLTLGIIPKHIFENQDVNTASENTKPVGTGPYKLVSWEPSKKIVLEANEHYEKQPNITNVIFKYLPDHNVNAVQLQTGEVDVTLLHQSQVNKFAAEKSIKIHNVDTAEYRAMMFNMKNQLWDDVKVRQALSYAVDRQAVVDGVLLGYGFAAYSPLQVNAYKNEDIEKYEFNLTKAAQLLDEAGWLLKDDGFRYKDGEKFQFTITAPASDDTRVSIAMYLATQFAELGIEVETEALDWSALDITDNDAFMLGWGSPFDADDHTYRLFHSKSIGLGYNYGSYTNEGIAIML